jgi:hypothetical protein
MIRSGLSVLALLAATLIPGEAYRASLQRGLGRSMKLTNYRITDSPHIGVPGRIIVGAYLLIASLCIAMVGRFFWPDLIPNIRPIMKNGNALTDDILRYLTAGAIVIGCSAVIAVVVGASQAALTARRLNRFQDRSSDALDNTSSSLPTLPWSGYSESWMQVLLAYKNPNVILHMRESSNQRPIAGRLLAADLFSSEREGRGLLVQPLGADGQPDLTRRIFVRVEDVKVLVTNEAPTEK